MSSEILDLLGRLPAWAASRQDIAAVALVGSRARGDPRPQSDVDVVILTENAERYTTNDRWTVELGLSRPLHKKVWGAITEIRTTLGDVEVEVGIGAPEWAATSPVDPGTRRVVLDGFVILYDPRHLLADLLRAVSPSDDNSR